MSPEEKLKEMLTGAGVVAETCKVHYDAFLKAGFTAIESLTLTGTFLSTTLHIAANRPKEMGNDD